MTVGVNAAPDFLTPFGRDFTLSGGGITMPTVKVEPNRALAHIETPRRTNE